MQRDELFRDKEEENEKGITSNNVFRIIMGYSIQRKNVENIMRRYRDILLKDKNGCSITSPPLICL